MALVLTFSAGFIYSAGPVPAVPLIPWPKTIHDPARTFALTAKTGVLPQPDASLEPLANYSGDENIFSRAGCACGIEECRWRGHRS